MGRERRRERQEDAARAAAQEAEKAIFQRVEEAFSHLEPPEAYRLHDAGDVDIFFGQCISAINEVPPEEKAELLTRLLAKVFYLTYERQRTKFTRDPEGVLSELTEKRDKLGEVLARDHAKTAEAREWVETHDNSLASDLYHGERGLKFGDPEYGIIQRYRDAKLDEARQRLVDMQKWLIPAHPDFYRDWLEGYMRQGGSVTWTEETFQEFSKKRKGGQQFSYYVAVHDFENLQVPSTAIIVPEGIHYETPSGSKSHTLDMNSYEGRQGFDGEVIACIDTIPRGFEHAREEALQKRADKESSVERMLHEFGSEPSGDDDV